LNILTLLLKTLFKSKGECFASFGKRCIIFSTKVNAYKWPPPPEVESLKNYIFVKIALIKYNIVKKHVKAEVFK